MEESVDFKIIELNKPEILKLGIIYLCKTLRYFTHAVNELVFIETEKVPTLACDKHWRLYYNPKYLEGRDPRGIAGRLLHELGHLLDRHHERLKNFRQDIANLGGDLAINPGIEKEGFEISDGFFPRHFNLPDNLLAEEYCRLLQDQFEEIPLHGPCGSCATGKEYPWELGPPESSGVRGVSEARASVIIKATAEAILKEKTRGNVSGEWLRWAEEKLSIEFNPFKELSIRALNLLMQKGSVDYTFLRPNKKSPLCVTLPSTYSPLPRVLFVLDSSGSMSPEELGMGVSMILRILKSAEVTLVVGDTEIKKISKITSGKEIKKLLVGGGGTSMKQVVEEAFSKKRNVKPDLIVLITDGETDWPEKVPVPILVGLTSSEGKVPGCFKVVKLFERIKRRGV
jgi:hypothetical protein